MRDCSSAPPVGADPWRHVRRLGQALALCVLLLGLSGVAAQAATAPPRFSWPAFRHFWNVYCMPKCEFTNVETTEGGHLVLFASGVSLVTEETGMVVRAARVVFSNQPEQAHNGRLFLRLVDSAIRVGTFQWPQEQIQKVHEAFRTMTPDPVRYQWRTSRFVREQMANGAWVFSLSFVMEGSTD